MVAVHPTKNARAIEQEILKGPECHGPLLALNCNAVTDLSESFSQHQLRVCYLLGAGRMTGSPEVMARASRRELIEGSGAAHLPQQLGTRTRLGSTAEGGRAWVSRVCGGTQCSRADPPLAHPSNRNTGACCHPKLRKSGAIREPWCWGPRPRVRNCEAVTNSVAARDDNWRRGLLSSAKAV
jgi:hypothetical protein